MLMCALVASADAEAKSPPPTILIASIKGDELVSRVNVPAEAPVTVVKEVEKDGKKEKVTVTEIRVVTRTIDRRRDLKKATIMTAGGKKLTLEDARKRLAKPQPIVLSGDGKEVDAASLKLFDKAALVIFGPLPEQPIAKPDTVPLPPKKD